jgi:putative ABC transport system permease protein
MTPPWSEATLNMWRNYFTVALRSIGKSKTYSIANIAGLAIGMAACIMILLYVRYETSYDKWLPHYQRIFQVQTRRHEQGQPVVLSQRSPLPIRDTLAAGFPQIEAVSVVMPGRLLTVRSGQPIYIDAILVDPPFFKIFDFQFIRGSASRALPDVSSIVLTQTEALRQFGTVDVLGRTITEKIGSNSTDYRVTGVIQDVPKNSHFAFGAVFRFDPSMYDGTSTPRDWGNIDQLHYVLLRNASDARSINAALPRWETRTMAPQVIDGRAKSYANMLDFKLVNIANVHLSEAKEGAVTPGGDASTIATFAIIAGLILIIACINFVNLSTARAGQRAREVALRKVVGATRRQLIAQFVGESIVISAIAMLVGLSIVEILVSPFGTFLDADLRLDYFGEQGIWLPIAILTLLVGLLSGLYPAFFLSGFQPGHVLKANRSAGESRGSGRLRTMLVIAQFAVSTGLIICTIVIYAQTRFVQSVDPGYRRVGLIQLQDAFELARGDNYQAFRQQLLAVPGVVSVARTNLGVAAANRSVIEATVPGGPTETEIGFYRVDQDYFTTLGTRLLAGRTFSDERGMDLLPAVADDATGSNQLGDQAINIVINRRAAEQLGYFRPVDAVGKTIETGIDGTTARPSTIIGVIENTRLRSARQEVESLIFSDDPKHTSTILVRYQHAVPSQVMKSVASQWSRFEIDRPFNGAFAEDLVGKLYQQDETRGAVFFGFSILTIGIAALGLFGLAAFLVARRTKEIGIRKVFGARTRDIVHLLVWQFSRPVVLANLIAWPLAWWVMRSWLNGFDERIVLGPGPFVLASVIALSVAIGTVVGHTLRVARANPIHALRYE